MCGYHETQNCYHRFVESENILTPQIDFQVTFLVLVIVRINS